MAARSPVPVDLRIDLDERLPEHIEVAVYYVVSESLANVSKHAHAAAVTVTARRTLAGVLVEVVDDGVGGAALDAGSGLRGLADRVERRWAVASRCGRRTAAGVVFGPSCPAADAHVSPRPMAPTGSAQRGHSVTTRSSRAPSAQGGVKFR